MKKDKGLINFLKLKNSIFFNIGPINVSRTLRKPKNGSPVGLPPEGIFVYLGTSLFVWVLLCLFGFVLCLGSSLFFWGPLCLFGFFSICLGSSLFAGFFCACLGSSLFKT